MVSLFRFVVTLEMSFNTVKFIRFDSQSAWIIITTNSMIKIN
jgi:hypothetical protein